MNGQPTVRAISAVLRKAGFEQAVMTNNSRHHKEHTAGFRVWTLMSEVRVDWWAQTARVFVQEERAERQQMVEQLADAIRSAGWQVTGGGNACLVVRRCSDDE